MEARDTYGRAVTDWSRVTVGQMWQMIGDHNPEPGHSQAGAWDRTRELVDHHLTRIQSYREDLVRMWNPQTSPAAAMYFARIDALIESMTAVRDGSSATAAALVHVNASLAEARTKLEPVYRQWADHQAKIDTYLQAEKTHQPGVPADWGGPALPLRQRELQAQAVTIMSTLGSHIREGTNAMVEPPPYDPPKVPPGSDPSGPIPSSSSRAGGSRHGVPLRPSGQAGSSAAAPDDGQPILSGGPSAPPARGLPPPVGFPGESPPISPPVLRPVEHPAVGRIIGATGPSGRVPTDLSFPQARRALPPGGLIGGAPFEGVEPGWPASAAGPRANPPGGVIGPTTGRETEGMFAPAVGGGGRAGAQRNVPRNHAYDSDEYWPVKKGVRPVIEPGPEPTHDPGPYIGRNP